MCFGCVRVVGPRVRAFTLAAEPVCDDLPMFTRPHSDVSSCAVLMQQARLLCLPPVVSADTLIALR